MKGAIDKALNSIEFVNRLSINKEAIIGDLKIKVLGTLTMDNAFLIRNILLLLDQAGRLTHLKDEMNIDNWIYISKLEKPEEQKQLFKNEDDTIDAYRYAVELTKMNRNRDSIQEPIASNTATKDSLKLENNPVYEFIENNKEEPKEKSMMESDRILSGTSELVNKPKAEVKKIVSKANHIPDTFEADMDIYKNNELAEKYGKSVSTIKRWKKVLKNESGK